MDIITSSVLRIVAEQQLTGTALWQSIQEMALKMGWPLHQHQILVPDAHDFSNRMRKNGMCPYLILMGEGKVYSMPAALRGVLTPAARTTYLRINPPMRPVMEATRTKMNVAEG